MTGNEPSVDPSSTKTISYGLPYAAQRLVDLGDEWLEAVRLVVHGDDE